MYFKTLKTLLSGLCIASMAVVSWTSNSLAGGEYPDDRSVYERLGELEQELSEMKAEAGHAGSEHGQSGAGFLSGLGDHVTIHGLFEVGAAYHSTDINNGSYEHDSDISMTTVELEIEADISHWVSAEALLLYEDPSGAIDIFDDVRDETGFEVEEAFITIANAERTPAFLKAGKMIVPFGALLTHFPDDPGIDAPVTLLFGETIEKALLVGAEYRGFTFSTYAFNGDVEENTGSDNVIESYGFDANYAYEDKASCLDMLAGASYISNIADSDWTEETLHHHAHVQKVSSDLQDYAGGVAVYFHGGYAGLFLDAEYMAATDSITTLLTHNGIPIGDMDPEVWNFEAGYNYDWGLNSEIALKYAGSHDCGVLGLPRDRYGINLNQEIFEQTTLSVGYLYDEYEDDEDVNNRNTRDLVFAQLAVEF